MYSKSENDIDTVMGDAVIDNKYANTLVPEIIVQDLLRTKINLIR